MLKRLQTTARKVALAVGDDTSLLVSCWESWSWWGTFGSVARKYLSVEEMAKVHVILDHFVGLPLTDVWEMYGFIFEFGEQKPFMNKLGEEARRSNQWIKAVRGFEITGLEEAHLTDRNLWNEFGQCTPIGGRFIKLVEGGNVKILCTGVDRFGGLKLELSDDIRIHIYGQYGGQTFDNWLISDGDRTCFSHKDGLLFRTAGD